MISIILPTYNERENIKHLLNELKKNLSKVEYEIIVVDDNSPDGTYNVAKMLVDKNKNLKVFIRKNEKGLGSAIKFGIEKSRGNLIVVMDADFNHPPSKIPEMTKELDGYDLVIASRFIKGGSMASTKIRFYLSMLLNFYIKILLKSKIHDITCGYFVMKKHLLNNIDLNYVFSGYGDYFFRLICELERGKIKIKEIPVVYGTRRYGKSKTDVFKMGIKYGINAIKTSLRYKI